MPKTRFLWRHLQFVLEISRTSDAATPLEDLLVILNRFRCISRAQLDYGQFWVMVVLVDSYRHPQVLIDRVHKLFADHGYELREFKPAT